MSTVIEVFTSRLGIFWRVPHAGALVLLADGIPVAEAEPYGDRLGHPYRHAEVWEAITTGSASTEDISGQHSHHISAFGRSFADDVMSMSPLRASRQMREARHEHLRPIRGRRVG